MKDVPVWSMGLQERVLPDGRIELCEQLGATTIRGRGRTYYEAVAALRQQRTAAKR